MRPRVLALAVIVSGLALWYRARSASSAAPIADAYEDVVNAITPGSWTPPSRAAPYLEAIYAEEDRIGAPRNLLARLFYQESRYRPDVIDGTVRSSAGATGIAQLMPAVSDAYGIDPTDPWSAIHVAAEEMRKVYARFGSWPDALAAYNWGQGNWNAYLRTGVGAKGQARPQENIAYVADIAAAVGLA